MKSKIAVIVVLAIATFMLVASDKPFYGKWTEKPGGEETRLCYLVEALKPEDGFRYAVIVKDQETGACLSFPATLTTNLNVAAQLGKPRRITATASPKLNMVEGWVLHITNISEK